jgi:hypothetical protein
MKRWLSRPAASTTFSKASGVARIFEWTEVLSLEEAQS